MRSLVAPAVLVFAACVPPPVISDAGGGEESPTDAGPTSVSASEYCETTVGFFCDYYLRCGRMAASSLDECRATFLETCNARYEPRYVDLEDAGLLSFSPGGVEACRAWLAGVACERQLTDLMGPCAGLWTGTQPAGRPCGLDVESFTCAAGTTCVLGLNLCGTCTPASAAGGPCGGGGTCLPEAACVSGSCVARRQVGEACSGTAPCVVGASCASGTCLGPTVVAEGAACDSAHRCPYRTACLGGVCVRAALLGEDCSGRTCASGRCVTEGAVKVCRPFLEVGAVCAAAADCRSASCVGGVCRRLPDACFP